MTNTTDRLIYISKTDSTNTYLANLCDRQNTPDLTTIWTSFQTAGRGQRGNSWESEAGCNLLFSYVVFPEFLEIKKQFLLSEIGALAYYDVLSAITTDISIKWPNDIYWKDYKISGTLIENDLTGMHISRSIAGTGININQEHFISNAPNPVSLFQITGKKWEILPILEAIIERVDYYYSLLQNKQFEEINSRYMDALYRKEGYHTYKDPNGLFQAEIQKIDPSGRLFLKDEAGNIRSYMFKEVQYIIGKHTL